MVDVGPLVLTHFVPGDLPPGRWHEAAEYFDGELVVAGDPTAPPQPAVLEDGRTT